MCFTGDKLIAKDVYKLKNHFVSLNNKDKIFVLVRNSRNNTKFVIIMLLLYFNV